MLISILIPTYNRVEHLRKNISILEGIIVDSGLLDVVSVCISNNCSDDGTADFLSGYVAVTPLSVEHYNQPVNIGSVNNVLFLLGVAETPYIMFLGDDDFIGADYLRWVVSLIGSDKPSVIIPSNRAIDVQGKELPYSRDVEIPSAHVDAGYKSCFFHSWRGHQMSGLVFRREGLAEVCRARHINNMYLFIFLVAYSALRGRLIHLTDFPVLVSRPSQQDKGWSYGDDGLVSEIFENYIQLKELNYIQRVGLELNIFYNQYWRYMMYLKLGPRAFFTALKNIFFGRRTSLLGGLLAVVLVPFFLVAQVVRLLFRGALISTLSRPVDI